MSVTHAALAAERTAALVQAAFGEVEAILGEHGFSENDIATELLHRAVFAMWSRESREALRTKAVAAAINAVDALFDSIETSETRRT